jgi:HlyD family secretion protein
VFVVKQGRARLQEITIGQRNSDDAQIVRGLNVGDLVVMYPPDTLADGARVAIRKP